MRINGFTSRTNNGHEAKKTARPRSWVLSVVLSTMVVLATAAVTPLVADDDGSNKDWPMFGQNTANTASGAQTSITTGNVGRLAPKWVFTTGGDVSARAALVNGVVYFPDWGGNLWAVNADNGKLIWSHQISDYGLPANTHARSTPAVNGGHLYIGTQEGAWMLKIDADTGNLDWKTQLDTVIPFPISTTSPVIYQGVVYAGVASSEEGVAADPSYPCCSARGSVVALDADTGAILWQTYTVPTGYTGGGIWGSNPIVDADRNTLFIGVGNNYSHPTDPAYLACIAGGGQEKDCLSPNDHVDSIIALDLHSGAVNWATRLVTWSQQGVTSGSDDWNVACFVPPYTNCPANLSNMPTGPDFDFGSAPNEISYKGKGGQKTIIGAGQKSGIYYALDPDSGAVLWQTQVGPGSSLGGMEWGSATDGQRIYVAISNFYGIPYGYGSAGSWAALDPATGAILWQVADPNGAIDIGPVAVAKGVVYVDSMAGSATAPTMLALDASTGNTLWSYAAGSSVNAGAVISGDSIYWGSGYAHLGIPGYTGNNKFYAFSRNGK